MRLVVRLHATSLSRPNAVDCATISCLVHWWVELCLMKQAEDHLQSLRHFIEVTLNSLKGERRRNPDKCP